MIRIPPGGGAAGEESGAGGVIRRPHPFRRMRKIRTIAIFPTLFTLGNLFCGFFSIVVAARVDRPVSPEVRPAPDLGGSRAVAPVNPTGLSGAATSRYLQKQVPLLWYLDPSDPTHNAMLSGWLIFLAMVFDALDGHVARLARTSSDFGAQLDSLCDLVTFGVAPAFLLVKMCPQFTFWHPDAVWIIAASYTACAALRLARFNVETSEEEDHLNFSGLPSPAAAGSIAGFAILFYTLRREGNTSSFADQFDGIMQHVLPIYALAVGALMVSRIPYPHIVNQIFRGQRSFGHLVGVLFALVAVMVIRGYSVPILCCGFVLWPAVRYFWQRILQRHAEDESLF